MTTTEPLWLPDVNVLVALTHPNHVHHHASHRWFMNVQSFATTPMTETGLLRLSMNPAVAGRDISPAEARRVLTEIRALLGHQFIADTATLADPLITSAPAGYKQVTDLHLVNLAARSNAVLVTFDSRLLAALQPADRDHVHALSPIT